MIDVPMPQLGESVAEGTVTKWLVKEGDWVEREQPILQVSTDKADTEVTAPANGRVASLVAKEGEIIAKGGVLCRIDETASKGATAPAAAAPAPAMASAANGDGPAGLASPSTRRMALEHGVNIGDVRGTGDGGRVTQADVLRAAQPAAPPISPVVAAAQIIPASPSPAAVRAAREVEAAAASAPQEISALIQAGGGFVPPIPGVGFGAYKVPPYVPKAGDQVVPFTRRRQITADHMVYSKMVSPHVVTVAEVDLAATSKLRDQHKDRMKKEGVSLTFLAFICAATIKALRENPNLNARVLEKSYVVLKDINLGVAVDTPGGLVVPSIKHADQLSLRGVASAISELAERAKAGKVTADDLAGTSFSVSNPGLKGNLYGGAIISQPNVGILRMGEIKKRPVVVTHGEEDAIAIHPVMYMALSYDHRIVDGVDANEFLHKVVEILETADFSL
ncbi:MAG TPA: dihydrolipoamide acetyltransferase family protein [Polyangiaceae bacterium]|nr:dihydrolipoamide acetyltransferase family protein [Polyangiaceae bacterium]